MPGINLTGAPNTRDYILGRGRLLARKLINGVVDPDGYRNLGNVSEFSVSSEVEELEHQQTQTCIKTIDKTFLISQELALAISLEEVGNYENVALFLSGDNSVYDNAHDATFADAVQAAVVKLGNWYPLVNATGERVYNLGAAGAVYVLEMDDVADVTLVEGTDYEIDEELGYVRLLPTAVNIADGDTLLLTLSAAATVPVDLDQVDGLTSSAVELELVFIQENAGDCGQTQEWFFPLVSVRGEGDLALIGDEVSVMQLTGTAQVDLSNAANTSPVRLRTYDMAA